MAGSDRKEVPALQTTARRAVVFSCTIACTVVVTLILKHPETPHHISLLGGRVYTEDFNHRSDRIKQDLRRLEEDLSLRNSYRTINDDASRQYDIRKLERILSDKNNIRTLLHEGYSEDTQRRSEDIEPEARERILSGEWPAEIVKADQDRGFMPPDLSAIQADTGERSSDDTARLIAIAEHQAKEKLAEGFSAKEMALKRAFQYKEKLLDNIAKHPHLMLALSQSDEQSLQDLADNGNAAAKSMDDSPIGPSGIIAGDGTHLRKDVRLVGERLRQPPEQRTIAESSSHPFFNQQLTVYPYSASLRKAAESRIRSKANRIAHEQSNAVARPARTQQLTWPRPSPSTVPRSSYSGATMYDSDYNWPTFGQVHRNDEWENRGDCGMWGGNC